MREQCGRHWKGPSRRRPGVDDHRARSAAAAQSGGRRGAGAAGTVRGRRPATVAVLDGRAHVGLDKASWSGWPRTSCGSWATVTWRPRWRPVRAGRRRCPPPRSWPRGPGSGSSRRAAWAVSTATGPRPRTSRPICGCWPGHRSRWFARASSRSSTYRRPFSAWRRWRRSSATARSTSPASTCPSGEPVDWTVRTPEEVAAVMGAQDGSAARTALIVANPVPEAEQLDPGCTTGARLGPRRLPARASRVRR